MNDELMNDESSIKMIHHSLIRHAIFKSENL